MTEFLKHGPCSECSSSDASARYSDGSRYCFSCGHYSCGSGFSFNPTLVLNETEDRTPPLPGDLNRDFPPDVMGWLGKYKLTGEELVRHNVFYSPSRRQLIFGFFNEHYEPTVWQARNFSAGPKYVTHGSRDAALAHYWGAADNKVCVITEDCVSAIRVARHTGAGVPCLGSSLSLGKVARLRAHFGPSWRFLVWLDSDMYDRAQQIATRLRLIGSSAMVLWTPGDPKEYNDAEMASRLQNA